jgi:uncharacterized protein YbaR (Trm112 family)
MAGEGIDANVLQLLACPACGGDLDPSVPQTLACSDCGRNFPVVDEIPILLADRAVKKQPA